MHRMEGDMLVVVFPPVSCYGSGAPSIMSPRWDLLMSLATSGGMAPPATSRISLQSQLVVSPTRSRSARWFMSQFCLAAALCCVCMFGSGREVVSSKGIAEYIHSTPLNNIQGHSVFTGCFWEVPHPPSVQIYSPISVSEAAAPPIRVRLMACKADLYSIITRHTHSA